ncbi:PsbP-related protein [Tenacibaculum sp. C7A-26P2]|uniref:PsbP-related protein n=1 Tax=Tenacibaculum sp. C7A-26P2 TaxID=3447504 RepID=UPI003F826E61
MYKFSVLFFLLIHLTGCSQEKLIDYKSTQDGFSFSYDDSWEKKIIRSRSVFLTKGDEKDGTNFRNNLNVIVQDLSQNLMSLEDYHNLTLQQMQQALGENTVTSDKDVTIGGVNAKELIYTIPKDISKGNFLELKLKQVYLIKNSKAYLITYTAKSKDFAKYLKSANFFFTTFKLL